MPHYKDQSNGLYFLSEEDLSLGGFELMTSLHGPCMQVSDEEANAIRASALAQQIVTAEIVRAEGARRLALIGAPYSPEERETWSQQVMEAKAIQADANADAPLLTLLAAADGVPVAAMAATVLAKAEAFAAAAGAVLATQRALLAMDPIPADYADASRWP